MEKFVRYLVRFNALPGPQRSYTLMRRFGLLLLLVLGVSQDVLAQSAPQFFDSNGVQIHYMDKGSGEPVVLMHGLNGDYEGSWIESGIVQELLDADYRVLALDGRAHGQSGTPHDPAQYGPEMALDVARLLTHVGLEKAHIVGYSMGALIVGKLREMEPGRLITLTLGGNGWSQRNGPSPSLAALADSLERGSGFMPLYRNLYPDWSDDDREARSAVMVAKLPDTQATIAMLRGWEFRVSEESLRSNTIPTLAIIGETDPRKESVDALQGVMRNLETVVIPGADHAAARTHPMFVASLLEFLQRHPVNQPTKSD